MSIVEMINRSLVEKAVYWGNPTADGYSYTYDDPIEIDCRWEDKAETFIDSQGREAASRSVVVVGQDLDMEGYLYHGELVDLSVAEKADPKVAGAHLIRNFSKIPGLGSTTVFLRKVYL